MSLSFASSLTRRAVIASICSVFLILALTATLLLRDYHSLLLHEREQKVKRTVENALSLISYYETKVERGELDPDKAKRYALETIRQITPDPNGYFWVIDSYPRGVMHPIKTNWAGEDLRTYVAPDGRHLFVDMVSIAQKQDGGFINYTWAKPRHDGEELYEKISYVRLFKPWDWVIGTGLYLEDINAAFWNAVTIACGLTLAVLLFAMVLTLTISESLKKPAA